MTPTKEPLKNSLAARKKVAPKLKNVLAQPLPRYWPEISETDCEELKQCFLKAVEGADKKNLQDIGIKLGTASCLRLLNRREVSCVLLSTEIKPKFIAAQVIYSVISKNDDIAVLCVPNLKRITGETFSCQSLMVAVSKEKQSIIEEWVRKKSSNFPLPEKLVRYYAPESAVENSANDFNTSQNKSNKIQQENEMIDFAQLYLTRNDPGCRAFIPANAKHIKPLVNESKDWPDYISLSNHTPAPVKMEVEEYDKNVESNQGSPKEVKQSSKKSKNHHKNVKKETKFSNGLFSLPLISSGMKFSENNTPKKQNVKKSEKTTHPKNSFNYISLKVNKIQGNPDKTRKKKNKKMKK